jgi:hypothetical protein
MGIDWWTRSSFLCGPQARPELPAQHGNDLELELRELRSRLDRLERSS